MTGEAGTIVGVASGGAEDGHWRRDVPVTLLIGSAHAGSHFFHLVLPPLFPFIHADLGIGYDRLGLAMAVFFAVSGLAQLVAGFTVDRLGARRILTAGLLLLGLGAVLAAMAQSSLGLIVAAAVIGAGNSVFHPADYAILSRRVSASRLGRAYSVHTIGGSLGWAMAPVTMTGLALAFDWRTALLVASLVGFALALLTQIARRELTVEAAATDGRGGLDLRFLREAAILTCFLFFVLQAFVMMGLQGFMPLALNKLFAIDLVTAATMLSLFLLGGIAGTALGGIVADRGLDLRRTIIFGYGASAMLLFLVGVVALPALVRGSVLALAGALQGLTTPSRDLLIRNIAGPARIGAVIGVVYSGLDLGGTVAPYASAMLIEAGLVAWFFPMVALVTLATAATVTGAQPTTVDETSADNKREMA